MNHDETRRPGQFNLTCLQPDQPVRRLDTGD